MFTFRGGALISKGEKIKIVKLYKQIQHVVLNNCNKSDDIKEATEELLIETINNVPGLLYVIDDNNKCLIDLIVENQLWSCLFEIAKKSEFSNIINQKLIEAKNKSKNTEINKG